MEYKLGELFCGPGGIAMGARMASNLKVTKDGETFTIVHQWASDIDADTCATYRKNICPSEPETVICKDVRELDLSTLAPINGLAFGFPCNDYSIVGEQKGINGKYGPLYTYGIKALKAFQPEWFIAENVSGIKSANKGKAFEKILGELTEAGYCITPHLYKFEDYGIPQARHRVIIVGIRKDLGKVFRVPSTDPYKSIDNSCRTALERPFPPGVMNNEPTRHSKVVKERLSRIKPGENAFTSNLPDKLKLNIKGATISQIYKRLDPDKPAYTVTGSGGGGTHIYHWTEDRALTNRERARLQTFPDEYVFLGSKEKVRKQIGMAVPCAGAQIIFEAILKTMAEIDYPAVRNNIWLEGDKKKLEMEPLF